MIGHPFDQKDTGDTITDFSRSTNNTDHIDLSALDVTTFDSTQLSDPSTLAAHHVGYSVSGGNVTVYVDTDGIAGADLEIHLTGVTSMSASDFILHP